MSWEVFGSGPDPIEPEHLYARGWESDPDCEKWWRAGEPDEIYTFEQACLIEDEKSWED